MYDVIVIGAGHAGCEAALAAARMGCSTLLLTMNLDNIALMPCNPSIGGPAKGHLVREIDALGGEMARITDQTFIQIRMLNTGKGPAVQALRAQSDKKLYALAMKHALESQPGLDLKQALVEQVYPCEARMPWGRALMVKDNLGLAYQGKTVVVTTGTSLAGRVIVGHASYTAGRAGEFAATGLSSSLREQVFNLGRLKTGTPPRIDARTIDFSQTTPHFGSQTPLHFSFNPTGMPREFPQPNPVYPVAEPSAWRPQLPCYQVYTNTRTHEVIRSNLHRAPLFTGAIKGIGPRYCPSIEDKVVRFADKESHGLFLEPEGWETTEVYVQGANTSLPYDVQLAMLRSIPALEKAEIMRPGYAIEYDYAHSTQIIASLESKPVPGLFLAGQINGTSGYEEAAAQGLIAGVNAALKVKGKPPIMLRRDQAYIGVMIDDLVTRDLTEPYRLFTSRAEFRLLLRHDNADLRLTPIGHDLGLVSDARHEAVEKKREAIASELRRLAGIHLGPGDRMDRLMASLGIHPLTKGVSALEFLRRPEVNYPMLAAFDSDSPGVSLDVAEQVETEAKYEGYIRQQQAEVERVGRLEERRMPDNLDYDHMSSLRTEARQRLKKFRPATLGQASRLEGVTPADVAVLLVNLERGER